MKNLKEQEVEKLSIREQERFFSEKVMNRYFKNQKTTNGIEIGKLKEVFYVKGKFYVRAWVLDVTTDEKVCMCEKNILFSEKKLKNMEMLNEEEYKLEFFDILHKSISSLKCD